MSLAGKKPSTAAVAKDRLRIILEHERNERNSPAFLPTLSKELRNLIEKHIQVAADDVQITIDEVDGQEILELCVRLPGSDGGETPDAPPF